MLDALVPCCLSQLFPLIPALQIYCNSFQCKYCEDQEGEQYITSTSSDDSKDTSHDIENASDDSKDSSNDSKDEGREQ